MKSKVKLIHGECLAAMAKLADKSVDLILCDLPYGTTQNKWDAIIDPVRMWKEYKRICTGAIVLTAAQPFTSVLVMSNVRDFKYDWVWNKSRPSGVLNAKKMPLRDKEDVLVFYSKTPQLYNPQGVTSCSIRQITGKSSKGHSSSNYGRITDTPDGRYEQTQTGYPRTVLKVASEGQTVHPTQKPVALMEYMVKTYTNEGMVVLDNCMGSGTTGVACVNLGRHFIGIEQDPHHFATAKKRIADAQ